MTSRPQSQPDGGRSLNPSGNRRRDRNPEASPSSARDDVPNASTRTQGHARRAQFGSQLTDQRQRPSSPSQRRRRSPPPNSDLTTRLTHALRTPPYPDCPICFNSLHPAQPTWSCSLSPQVASCCWSSFHLKCIREWARKSTKEIKDALVARGEEHEEEYWRCPGCQTKRNQVPRNYLCFCGAVTDPKPGIATPHSCGMVCSRKRAACDHPCPLSCHPGPCPPCILTIHPTCHCGKTTLSIRCARSYVTPTPSLSCGQACGRPLSCGNHFCEEECHSGGCAPCIKKEVVRCFCGKNTTSVSCGEGMKTKQDAFLIGEDGMRISWEGRYDCGSKCDRPFACGLHVCSKSCHPPSPVSRPCPFDSTLVTHCPCGKEPLRELVHMQRTKCTDPVPTCTSSCGKQLRTCTHFCSAVCHLGVCPPCTIPIIVPCRCGSTTRSIPCHERQQDIAQGKEVILCDKVCGGLRLCGRHQCSRSCCPLATMARNKVGKGKKGKNGPHSMLMDMELQEVESLWHECDLVCGKPLGCGLHKCAESDHRGPCPPCLQSSFDELVCRCGLTVIFPPVPCGTRINCTFPCDRAPPLCGHSKSAHTCHEDPTACPPCPFLTTKRCACGKSNIGNVRCSQEKVSCGQPCGKLLDCGFHRCGKLCHGDDCGACSSVCGKPRKLCLSAQHPCTLPCHAPSACNESEPCSAMVTISCPCGRFQQPMICGKCTSNPSKSTQQLHCRDECGIAKRNARLAEALGISADTKEKANVVYSEDLVSFGKADPKFLTLVEKALNDFVMSDKKTQVLPYMPESRRKFVRELCQLYRIDTQLVDQEPKRSIQVHRRIDTRTPSPVLSASIAFQNPISNLGKLADLRAMSTTSRSAPAVTRPSTGSTPSNRGWTSVLSPASQTGSNPATTTSLRASRATAVSTAPRLPTVTSSTDVRESWESD
ncbi:hypothetical protein K439DRAFT_1350445 [Ramaria rubella]|nr:hypothetical protein K439DRAFT_1350445 [Ramaria rubella]